MPSSRRISTGLAAAFLLGLPTVVSAADGDAENGATVYEKQCSQCHGADGAADGPAANFMLPRPRVFKDNMSYKFRTTGSGALPLDQDLFNIITRGIPGSSMPEFAFLSEQDRWDLVAFLKTLTEEFSDSDYTEDAVALEELEGEVKPPPADEGSLERGKQLYADNKCWQCHGETGRGNGPSFNELTDDWGNPILPLNLTIPEHFRGGAEPFDIYRTMSTGLNGTPMPAYRDSIDAEARWDLVNYIISLQPERKEQPDERIEASFVEQVPSTGTDEAWDTAPAARFKMMPNVVEPPRLFWPSVEFVTVQALYSASEVALRVQWDDRTNSTGGDTSTEYKDRNTEILKGTDHPDQFAVQFPAKMDDKARPYFLFGDKKRPTNLWWWRGDTGKTQVMIGKGLSSIKESDGAGVEAEVTYDDGRYTMVVRRTLTTEDDTNDIQLAPGTFVPIAFHAWDGDRGELGARHSFAPWYWLYLEPQMPDSAYYMPPIAFVGMLGFLLVLVNRTRKRAG